MKNILIALILLSSSLQAQEFIPLYPNGKIPNSKGTKRADSIANERIFRAATPGICYCKDLLGSLIGLKNMGLRFMTV